MKKERGRPSLPLPAQCAPGVPRSWSSPRCGQPAADMDQEAVGNVVLLAIVTLISVVQNAFFAHKVEHESKTQNGRSFQRTGTLAFERVYTANQNCVDAYPTFLVMLWSAGLLCSQGGSSAGFFLKRLCPDLQLGSVKPWRVPAAFAGMMYLFVRQKYFVGYLGERTQRCFNALRCTFLTAPHPLLPLFGVWGLNDFLCLASQGLGTPGYIFGKRIILFLFLMSLAGIFNYYLILFFGSDFENYIKTITTTISPLLLIP
ncbi:hypothetical protein HPG69_017605 [Diceros bicornis minor]|uniref:Arachidonate 5-lipoxygenase-activating protein n=1 Tax=Diceros bicornis minor TaxID=77932 RepID=A0A7J7EL48_DICBM|nr:hypothetical protein HPG69_017605 [Diceros bicornis minor]